MVSRLIYAAAFFCVLASRPDATAGRRRAPAADHQPAAEAPALRAPPACLR
jgi:hypothetical protein